MTLDIKDRLYTSSEVAEILGVSLRSVYRYLEEGKLDADIKTATGRHRFSKKNILNFLQPSEINNKIAPNESTEPRSNFTSTVQEDKFSPTDTLEDDFDFDSFFETDVVLKKEDSSLMKNSFNNNHLENNKVSIANDDEDLEKLFEELEKEFASPANSTNTPSSKISKLTDDDFDFDFDFLDNNESVDEYLKTSQKKDLTTQDKDDSKNHDLKNEDDFDFDFDFLDSFFENEVSQEKKSLSNSDPKPSKDSTVTDKNMKSDKDKEDFLNLDSVFSDLFDEDVRESSNNSNQDDNSYKKSHESKDGNSESWLEKFRKASEKVNENVASKKESNDDFDISSFFNNKNLTSSISKEKDSTKSISNTNEIHNDFRSIKESRKKEYYYISSLSGPKEIAQTIDKVARKFDLDYAFTLNAGLSLHKDISPFTLINVYINERDLEIFEDYLKLTPSSERDAHVCLMMAQDKEIFEDSYELNGLFVVSNVQLRSDFIDKGLDNYAREV